MKILIVSTCDLGSGASRAAFRLHRALRETDIDSRMLVLQKRSNDPHVVRVLSPQQAYLVSLLYSFRKVSLLRHRSRDKVDISLNGILSRTLRQKISAIDPELVHLHWIHNGFVDVRLLPTLHRPLAWSVHDMWAFTGACHCDGGCGRYTEGCGNCPLLGSSRRKDVTRRLFSMKRRIYARVPEMTVIGLSNWIGACAEQSALTRGHRCVVLPNPIDTQAFRPVEKKLARNILGLRQEGKLILFGATLATKIRRKGLQEFAEALRYLADHSVEILVFGNIHPEDRALNSNPAHYLGYLHDDISLRLAYSAADVTVVPSLQENLSNCVMESLSCGTPVVAFDVGGNRDMVDHESNGYLARLGDSRDLAQGIRRMLDTTADGYHQRSANARAKVERSFRSISVAQQYRELYAELAAR